MRCIKCGRQLPENAAFCPECGNSLSNANNQNSSKDPAPKKSAVVFIIAFLVLVIGITAVISVKEYRDTHSARRAYEESKKYLEYLENQYDDVKEEVARVNEMLDLLG